MKVLRKILSILFNPIKNLFSLETSLDSSFLNKHHIFIWILTLICVIGLMFIVYMLL